MKRSYQEIFAEVRESHGPHGELAVDILVAGAVMSTHAATHCETLAGEVGELTAFIAAKVANLGGISPDASDALNEYARRVVATLSTDRDEATDTAAEIASAVIQRAKARPEDIN